VGVESYELSPDEPGELAAHNRGDDGAVRGVALTTATFASKSVAFALGERHRSRARCVAEGSETVTAGGVTHGGVNGDRRFMGVSVDGADMRRGGAGNEMNMEVGQCWRAANLDDGMGDVEQSEESEERRLLFEDMVLELKNKRLLGD